jgi:hypothetical protein
MNVNQDQESGTTMALISKKTPEQRAIEAGIKEQEREVREKQREEAEAEEKARARAAHRESVRKAFFASPAGQARLAFERKDHVFQFAMDVMNQQANAALNAVCNEGWELVNGSHVFVEEGQESRNKVGGSGQTVATKGTTVGYYLFRRCEASRGDTSEPWEDL